MSFGTIEYRIPDKEPTLVPVNRPTLTVGSSPGNRLVLEHESVARRHARLTVTEGQLIVEDLGGPTGTFVAKIRVDPDAPRTVRPGEWVWMGQVQLRWLPPGAPPPPDRPPTKVAATPPPPSTPPRRQPPPPPVQPRTPPGAELQINLEPPRGKGSFVLELRHIGQQPATYQLSAGDAEDSLNYRFEQRKMKLNPGQWVTTPLFVTPKIRQSFGSRRTMPFVVLATPTDANGRPGQADGELIVRSDWPIWWIPIIVLVLGCILIGSSLAYFSYCPSFPFQVPMCTAPVIQVFVTDPEVAVVNPGERVTINWYVEYANTVRLEPGLGEVAPFGQLPLEPTESVRYTLTASGGGGTVTQEIEIRVLGTLPRIDLFEATPTTLVRGRDTTVTFNWQVPGAERVTISDVPGEFTSAGTITISAPANTTVYTLSAFNASTSDDAPVTAELIISVADATCRVTSSPAVGDTTFHEGPDDAFRVLLVLPLGTELVPIERTSTGEWLRVQTVGREGWVRADYVACATDVLALPTASPNTVPTVEPTPTAEPTAQPTPATSFTGSGLVSYRVVENGRVGYVAVSNSGAVTLLTDKDDARLLDYTPANGGLFALLGVDGSTQNLYLVRANGSPVATAINAGWSAINDADFSPDGGRLVVEAVVSGSIRYFVYDPNTGTLLNQPNFP